jgi:hypothetical protein
MGDRDPQRHDQVRECEPVRIRHGGHSSSECSPQRRAPSLVELTCLQVR